MAETQKAQNADEYIEKLRQQLKHNTECGTTHYNLAVALMGKKDYDAAEQSLHDAVEASPNLAEAYVLLGGLCLQRNDLEGCLRYNKHAVKARAGFSEGYANIGFVLLQLIDGKNKEDDEEKLDLAIKNLRKAIVHNPKFVQAYTTLGNAYLMKGLLNESIKANLEAVNVQPEFPIAHNNLAVAYLQKGEFDLAIEHCDKSEKLGFPVADALKKELEPYR
ncbi:Putative selenocysteine protein (fragment) [Desulfamplus magnetovallimortis]|uniref:Putative selenocysteine protein n=1 Tax=Desulfamplus magnetovallimortis TaxID=1246637 RepID=A0A1W1HBD8_9BACT